MLKLFLTVILSILAVSNGFEIQPRIIKGVRNKIGFFPYYVYLEIHGNQKDKVSGCGGTLISDRYLEKKVTFKFFETFIQFICSIQMGCDSSTLFAIGKRSICSRRSIREW